MEYNYTPSTAHYRAWPMRLYLADFYIKGREKPIRIINNLDCDWGEPSPVVEIGGEPLPMPELLVQRWWSPEEQVFYNGVVRIDTERAEQLWEAQAKYGREKSFTHIVTGMAPYGGTAIWLVGDMKSVLLQRHQAEAVKVTPEIYEKLCNDNAYKRKNIELPPQELLVGWMHQYAYRYVVLEEYWDGERWQLYEGNDRYYDNLDIISVEDKRTDGSFNYTDDLEMLDHHETALPRHLCVKWKEGRTDFEAHYWFDDKLLATMFTLFFRHHPNAKADLLVRIDTRAKEYGLALADSDEELIPETIPSNVYQMLVFRNNWEYYKSVNYSQEDGAWRW